MAQRNGRTTMELPEQFPAMTEHPAWEAGNRNLEHVGFSSEEIASLESVIALYQRGAYHEATPEYKRLALRAGSPAKLSRNYDACARKGVKWGRSFSVVFLPRGQEEQTMSQLQLSLLGEPVVQHAERMLTFSTRKALALLVYLAVEGGTHPRKTLSESFWPELDAEHGRAALRTTLLELRKLLERCHAPGEPAHLLIERDVLGIEQGSSLILDLRLIEAASKQVGRLVEPFKEQAGEARLSQLEQATHLARGPFLAGFTLRDAQFFDDWTRQQREYWHLRVHQLFDALSRLYERAGGAERASETVSRWLGFDPLHEEGYRRLMRLRFSQGDRAGALRAYASGRAVLAEQLQVEPEPETVALAKRIRHTAPVRSPQVRSLLPPHASPGQPPANLLDGPLLGRTAEFGTLIECYQRVHAGQPQLVLLQGETGIGKTRLTTEFVRWAQAQGADVLEGRALQTGRQLPYQPLIDVLRRQLEQ